MSSARAARADPRPRSLRFCRGGKEPCFCRQATGLGYQILNQTCQVQRIGFEEYFRPAAIKDIAR
jgi:hypothetical protein